ncbi:MAG: recombinase family protein [Nitrospira sp.]|nr:recombinase family protein [Nitrospira sp.]
MIVALYARVSTMKQAEKDLSIPDQLSQMRAWCKTQGHSVAGEYIEAGASATDDRRPVFQRMIAEACVNPSPFEAIVVHSLSRFFRDSLEFGLYERNLKRFGVRVLSITQQTSDDPSGEMIRRIFSVFDEYQSKENGKHTLRAMRENARQGFFNGSRPPVGYRTIEVELPGNKGKKKQLEVDGPEAVVVKRVFERYLSGDRGRDLGVHGLAAQFNQEGFLVRGRAWTSGRIYEVLTNRAYIGEHYFNKYEKRGGAVRRVKPRDEWVPIQVEPIIAQALFQAVQEKLASRSPERVPPRVVNCPTLLTGLLKCGICGAGMTLATGKGGKYRYYKCANRILKGKDTCTSDNLPTEQVDRLVLSSLADRVFTPARVRSILQHLQRRLDQSQAAHDSKVKELTKELERVRQRSQKLYEAVEKGLLPMDPELTERAHTLQVQRQALLTEIAGVRRLKQIPVEGLGEKKVQRFVAALRERLLDKDRVFSKKYLKLLVEEIRYQDRQLVMKGSYASVARVVGESKRGNPQGEVPTFDLDWLPGQDSNLRPAGYKAPNLSTGLGLSLHPPVGQTGEGVGRC